MSQVTLLPSERISPSVSIHSGRPATTSREIATFFGKRHDDVIKSIRNLRPNCPEEFTARNFAASEYTDETGRTLPMFILYRDGFMLLVMGYTGKKALAMKLAYIEAFNRMEAEIAASSHPLADDMVLPASPDRPSRRSDPERKQLTAIINTWVGMAPIHYASARAQVNAHFGVASVDALTVAQVREAIRWVQGKIDSLPAAAPTLSGDEISALPPSTVSPHLLCLSRIEEVRELIRATCHPGAVTMKMTPQERKLYYACHAACVAADEALAGAYGILDAGRRMAEAARM